MSPLCDLGILVDQAAEPTAAQDAHADVAHGWLRSAVGRILQSGLYS